jgi:hypothetical protein
VHGVAPAGLPNDGLVSSELVVGGALLIPAGPRTLEPPPVDAVDAAIGEDKVDVGPIGDARMEFGSADMVMPGPMVVKPVDAPESPVPLVPVDEKIEPPSALVVVLPLMPLEFEEPESVLPPRDVGVLRLPESDVGELMVDVRGGLVEVGLDNTPGVDTHGRGSIVWLVGFIVVGPAGFVWDAPAAAPAGFAGVWGDAGFG